MILVHLKIADRILMSDVSELALDEIFLSALIVPRTEVVIDFLLEVCGRRKRSFTTILLSFQGCNIQFVLYPQLALGPKREGINLPVFAFVDID